MLTYFLNGKEVNDGTDIYWVDTITNKLQHRIIGIDGFTLQSLIDYIENYNVNATTPPYTTKEELAGCCFSLNVDCEELLIELKDYEIETLKSAIEIYKRMLDSKN